MHVIGYVACCVLAFFLLVGSIISIVSSVERSDAITNCEKENHPYRCIHAVIPLTEKEGE